jgi:aspartyl-tRNA synthetase
VSTYKRTHNCGELRTGHVGKRVTLCGWVHRRRDHGGLIFIDVRDRFGLTQVVFNPEVAASSHRSAEDLRNEYVICVTGTVRRRPPETANPKLATGEIELMAEALNVLARAKVPPFEIEEESGVGEDIRLKYRYIDLRRPSLQYALALRHRVAIETRNYFDTQGFLEIETPFLTKSTPEGARDYLVPSRTQPGSFFALPQSPQLMKQLLMIAGLDRYFQICKCFRDEDLRADRQPEFSQIDFEMSFADEEDVFRITEGLMAHLFKQVMGVEISTPFERLVHHDALERFGTDKPDLRFGMEIVDVTEIVKDSEFKVFQSALSDGGRIRGFVAPQCFDVSRPEIQLFTQLAIDCGAKGLAWFKFKDGELKSPIAKYFTKEELRALREKTGAMESRGDLILLVADRDEVSNAALSSLRNFIAGTFLAGDRSVMQEDVYKFAWIVDFPLFVYNEEEKRYESEHHPFTAPKPEDIPLLDKDPLKARAASYDLVLNGCELGSGSVRIHDEELQHKVFKILKLDENVIRERFGFFLEALRYGAPPHAGAAYGLDRLVMIMAKRETIRDVISFPKTQKASCLMTGSPSPVSPDQLKELNIRIGHPVKYTAGALHPKS